jgi:hypothetical protein
VERFSFKWLNDVEVKEHYQVKILIGLQLSENLNDIVDINWA